MVEFNFEYYLIYFFVALISLIFATQADFKKNKVSNKVSNEVSNRLLFVISMLFIILYGFRANTIGTDTTTYLDQFERYETLDFGNDIAIYYVYKILHLFDLPFQFFLLLMSFLFVGFLSFSTFKNAEILGSNSILVVFCFISLFYFKTLGTNVIRQGVSLSFLLLAITNYKLSKGKKWKWMLPVVISVLFHFTSIIPILLYVLIQIFNKIKLKTFYLIYIVCLVLSLLSISILDFKIDLGALMIDDQRTVNYLSGTDEVYIIGFKPQFVAFNTFFLVLFIFIRSNSKQNIYYDNLFKYYLLLSGIFFLTFQIPYSDRWGLMSWIVIPFLISPVFSFNFPKKIQTVTCIVFIFIFIFFENFT